MSNIIKQSAVDSADASFLKITVAIVTALLLLLIAASLLYSQTNLANSEETGHTFGLGSNNKDEQASEARPKFVDLGTFTIKLNQDDGAQNLQTSISIKLTKPGLGEKIKASLPEIMHYVNIVLQSKRSSELTSREGKEILAQQIKEQVEYVMGFRKTAPSIGSVQADAVPVSRKNGISEVLFTSFIIQY